MKKLLSIIVLLYILSLSSCVTTNKGVTVDSSQEYTKIALDDFEGKTGIEVVHESGKEGALYYSTNITEGSVKAYYNQGLLWQTEEIFDVDSASNACGGGFYIDNNTTKITVIIEAETPANGEILIGFSPFEQEELKDNKVYSQIVKESGMTFELSDNKQYYVLTACNEHITKAIVPESIDGLPVAEIADRAFKDCRNLVSAYIPTSVNYIGEAIFCGCPILAELTIPFAGNKAPQLLTDIEDQKTWHIGYLFGKEQLTNSYFDSYDIENGATPATKEGYYLPETLKKVTMLGGKVQKYFFAASHLEEIVLAEGVKLIEYNSFWCCRYLKKITIPTSVTHIGHEAFYDCDSLTHVTIPDGIEIIHKQIFWSAGKLESIVLPSSVIEVQYGAFESTGDAFKRIYYLGTAEEFAAIEIGTSNELFRNAELYIYSEEKPEDSGLYWHYDADNNIEIWN